MSFKYYKSDFQLLVELSVSRQGSDGITSIPLTTATDFTLRFFVMGKAEDGYVASRVGSTFKNCSVVDDTHVIVYFDRKQMRLPTGSLKMEAEFIIPDTHYEGDQNCNVRRLYNTGVMLTDRADIDSEGTVRIDLLTPLAYVCCNDEFYEI